MNSSGESAAREQWRHKENSMTKPEGPAQEPQAKCGLCGEPMPPGEEMFNYHGYSGPCPKPPVPATPAPSQPAGAREQVMKALDWWQHSNLSIPPIAWNALCTARDALLDARQQTAAKDAELETFRCQLRDALKLHPNVTWFGTGLLTAAAAVVAERDSLREWTPIEQAPHTGEHILVTALGKGGFGTCGGVVQDICAVVHWWDHPGEEGWYLSLGYDDGAQLWPTHFKRLKAGKD